MTSSPDPIAELRAARPRASEELRARVREISSPERAPAPLLRLRLPSRRAALVALPAAAALALASAGAIGLSRSAPAPRAIATPELATKSPRPNAVVGTLGGTRSAAQDSALTAPGRAQQVAATLALEVRNSSAVSSAAQDALELTRSLGGYVVSSSVSTGSTGSASLVVRVPVGRVQDAIVGLSALGRITSQQVNVQDLQEGLDALQKREAAVRAQIARIRARLATQTLDPVAEAALRSRLQTLRSELVQLRSQIAATNAAARMATVQLTITTPEATGVVPPSSRVDRTIDDALNVLAWEGVVALGLVVVIAPFALAGTAVWLGRRAYRRREEERLLAA